MATEFLQLVAHVFFDVLEGVEEGRGDGFSSGTILDSRPQILFGGLHQSAIGVINDHELLRAEQMMRHDQGPQGVVRYDSTGVSDDVGVSLFQSESASRKAGIHASQDRQLAFWTRRQSAQFMNARVNFLGGQNFVYDA